MFIHLDCQQISKIVGIKIQINILFVHNTWVMGIIILEASTNHSPFPDGTPPSDLENMEKNLTVDFYSSELCTHL